MKYNSSIQILLDEINKRFEPGTFEIQPSNDPGIIGFKSNNHKEVYLSIVTTGLEKNKYSVQVTLEGEKYKQKIAEVDNTVLSISFDIPLDTIMNLEELLRVFDKYK